MMDMPEKYAFVLTDEGRAKCKADLEIMAKLIDGANEIAERYGFTLSVSINEVKE